MKKKIKLFDPFVGSDEENAIKKTMQSHFWASGAGTGQVSQFENHFKKYVSSKSAVAVNNGTSALHLALSLIDIKGKQVILPSMSFVSTAHAVLYNGGTPTFVDIDEKTLCINPLEIDKHLNNKTAVILPVHFGGMSADLEAINKIALKKNCTVIEDAAHAVGTRNNGDKIGSNGLAVCFSFHPVKNLAMPTGGLVTLNGKDYKKHEKLLKSRRWCGITNRTGSLYDVTELGWNMYMNEFSAAIGLVQLAKLDKLNVKRRSIAKTYSKELDLEKKMSYDKTCSYHLYWIRVKNRAKFMKNMENLGIETGIHYKPIHLMSFYKNKEKIPITEQVGREILSIPIHPNLTDQQVDYIVRCVNRLA